MCVLSAITFCLECTFSVLDKEAVDVYCLKKGLCYFVCYFQIG